MTYTYPKRPVCATPECDRIQIPGWTTCAGHYKDGRAKRARGFQRGAANPRSK